MSMTLYEITERYSNLAALMDDDEIPAEDILPALDTVDDEFDEKADNVACFIKNLTAEAAAIRAEEQALAERRKAKEAKAKKMKDYLSEQMTRTKKDRIETARNVLSFRKSYTAEITDAKAVQVSAPSACTLVQDVKIDKNVLKKLLKTGEVSGAHLEEHRNLQVK